MSSGERRDGVKVTFHGFADHDDGQGHSGTDIIAHHLDGRHVDENGDPVAGGLGTFADPITATTRAGDALMPPGPLLFLLFLKKYLTLEDDCASCDVAAHGRKMILINLGVTGSTAAVIRDGASLPP